MADAGNESPKKIDAHLGRDKAARDLLTAAVERGCSGLETCDLVKERRGRIARKYNSRAGDGPPGLKP